MSNKLQELRAKLLEKESRQNSFTSDNAIYPFWNIPFDATAILRFLPDGDETNDFFWVERQMIRLTFPGIVGEPNPNNKDVFVQVPCMEMWSDTCPVLTEIRPWFKDNSLEDLARKYWKKRSYIFQGFVRDNPMQEDDGPENPIRRFVINPSIFDAIKAALMDPEMDEIPTDYTAGTDFRLTKTKQGEWANYATSSYSRKTSSLTEAEVEAVEKYGLFNLTDFLPKKPGTDAINTIAEMFEASVNGELYDPAKWANFYKPAGFNNNNSSVTSRVTPNVASKVTSTVSESPTETASTEVVEPKTETPPVTASVDTPSEEVRKKPDDILADIKARAAAQRG